MGLASDPTKGTDSDTYGAGDVITFEVKFTEAVTVTGAPRLRFKISGTGDDYAPYLSGSGANTNGIYLYADPLDYPDADADSIVGASNNLPAANEGIGKAGALSGHKVDGSMTY